MQAPKPRAGLQTSMERQQFWIFLAIGIAVGGGVEWLKRSAPSPWRPPKLMIAEEDASGHRSRALGAKRPLPKLPLQTSASLGGLAPAIAPAAKAPLVAAQAAKKKDDKKKKKKDEKKKPEAATMIPPPAPSDAKDKPKAAEQAPTPSAIAPTTAFGGFAPDAYVPRTLEDWRAYLLSRADRNRAELLLKQYRAGSVTSEVFYEVVHEMLGDSRPEMRRLGLYCLSATPSEPSFASLVEFLATNPTNADRSEAQGYLNGYGDRRQLPILAAALQATGNADVNMQAMNVLRSSADKTIPSLVATNSTGRVPSTTGGDAANARPLTAQQIAAQQQQRAAVIRQYASMVQLLNRLAGTYPSAQLRRAASDTSTHIQTVLTGNGLTVAGG